MMFEPCCSNLPVLRQNWYSGQYLHRKVEQYVVKGPAAAIIAKAYQESESHLPDLGDCTSDLVRWNRTLWEQNWEIVQRCERDLF